jgi:hypothetical protein
VTGVLELEARARVSRNGNEQVREAVMARTRLRARELAQDGLSVHEIEVVLDNGFNHTEQEILWLIASHEVDRARGC